MINNNENNFQNNNIAIINNNRNKEFGGINNYEQNNGEYTLQEIITSSIIGNSVGPFVNRKESRRIVNNEMQNIQNVNLTNSYGRKENCSLQNDINNVINNHNDLNTYNDNYKAISPIIRKESGNIFPNSMNLKINSNYTGSQRIKDLSSIIDGFEGEKNQQQHKVNYGNTVEYEKTNILDDILSQQNQQNGGINRNNPIISNNFNKIQINNVNNIINNIITPSVGEDESFLRKLQSQSVDNMFKESKLKSIKKTQTNFTPQRETNFIDVDKECNDKIEYISRRQIKTKNIKKEEDNSDLSNNILKQYDIAYEQKLPSRNHNLITNSAAINDVNNKNKDTIKLLNADNSRRRAKI